VSTDHADLTEPRDPALDGLFRALTADGTADEMAGRTAALEMFRTNAGRPPRRRPHRLRLAVSVSAAAAALVLTGGIASAYAAALPAPVQHIAYRMLGRIGVPDTRRPEPSASRPAPGASAAPAPSASATGGCPCPATGRPGAGSAPSLSLVAARTQVPAGGPDVLSGRLTVPGPTGDGRPEGDVRVRLLERVAGHPGGRVAGSAVTNANGAVTLTVAHLDSNAWFRLTARGGVVSAPVLITVIPPVSLHLAPGPKPGMDTLTARAASAGTGDAVVLQERAGGVWYAVGRRALGSGHLASFSVLVPASGQVAYRVVLPRTAEHGRSVSTPVRVGTRAGKAKKPGRRAPP
jgi:hypothetical protein